MNALNGVNEDLTTELRTSPEMSSSTDLRTAQQCLEDTTGDRYLTTMSNDLDGIFGQGLRQATITEISCGTGAGKTQLAFQLAVNATLPPDEGGLNKNTLWIDSEGEFNPRRIIQLVDPSLIE